MNIDKIREDFPFIEDTVYFDNACITVRPYPVINAVKEYYNEYPVCGGRSIHSYSVKLIERIEDGRKAIKTLLNAGEEEEVVFTKNTTEAINLVARGLDWDKDNVVITTDKEHNSNLAPWISLRKREGVKYLQFETKDGDFDLESFKKMMDEDVKLISMAHTSNLDGATIPAKAVSEIAHDYDSLFMLDAAQSIPHRPIDVKELNVDLLAFSVHKMLGPTGVGVLYGKSEVLNEIDPLVVGGGGVKGTTYERFTLHDSPKKFESGLQNYGSLCGVKPAVDYIMDIGLETVRRHETELNEYVTERLKDHVDIIGPEKAEKRAGIFNFRTDKLGCHEIALLLEEEGVLTRPGMQCVHSWHRAREQEGGTRVSFYIYNTKEEVERLVDIVKDYVL